MGFTILDLYDVYVTPNMNRYTMEQIATFLYISPNALEDFHTKQGIFYIDSTSDHLNLLQNSFPFGIVYLLSDKAILTWSIIVI